MKSINFDLNYCIGCDREFNSDLAKTKHHIYPMFLNPKTKASIPLCKECHNNLNNSYVHVIQKNGEIHPEKLEGDYKIFFDTYSKLRGQFMNKKLDRGQFGEELWKNLVLYLQKVEERLK